jgi:ABC-type branched-subunit amino acid transport system ATPase component
VVRVPAISDLRSLFCGVARSVLSFFAMLKDHSYTTVHLIEHGTIVTPSLLDRFVVVLRDAAVAAGSPRVMVGAFVAQNACPSRDGAHV